MEKMEQQPIQSNHRQKQLVYPLRILSIAFTLLFCFNALAIAQSLKGRVLDTEGNALIGANIILAEQGRGISTDENGTFELKYLRPGVYEIKISYVGYHTLKEQIEIPHSEEVEFVLKMDANLLSDGIIVNGLRVGEKAPTTFSNIDKSEIEDKAFSQDLPLILEHTPSMVTTTDAGIGIGYSSLRIRGTDPTRINVTVNGIPLNDAESQGVWWVNMPDISSSLSSVQIQRGVGTSTNGSAAFGASINLETEALQQNAYADVSSTVGSFNSRKYAVNFGTGLMRNRWAIDARLSKVASDGYIDRATADLKSYYFSAGYFGKKTIVKFITFAGHEKTYQAWYGTPESRLTGNVAEMEEVIGNNGFTDEQAQNLLNSDRTYNYYTYDNEVDNYKQDHFQLHINHTFTPDLSAHFGLNYTMGRGYYEQYRNNDKLEEYNLPDLVIGDEVIKRTDLIRRRWLDNDSYSGVFSFDYRPSNYVNMSFGGSVQEYNGDHFGEVIWAKLGNIDKDYRYYFGQGDKTDYNLYYKANVQVSEAFLAYVDLQLRSIKYKINGTDNDLRNLSEDKDWTFFNPKAGFTYSIDENTNMYASFAISNREPVRSDIIDAPANMKPKSETLYNLELGFRKKGSFYDYTINYYLMSYDNQLVQNGELNDVGSNIRVNVKDSYRTGVELNGAVAISQQLQLGANLTVSQNKIAEFTEVLYDYGPNWDEYNIVTNTYKDTDISFSPNVVAGGTLSYSPAQNLKFMWLSKYVGRQYLDNTQRKNRSVDPYFVNDLKVNWNLSVGSKVPNIELGLLVNNILDHKYESHGYTFGYLAGDYVVRENYYYPQAGRHFLAQVRVKF